PRSRRSIGTRWCASAAIPTYLVVHPARFVKKSKPDPAAEGGGQDRHLGDGLGDAVVEGHGERVAERHDAPLEELVVVRRERIGPLLHSLLSLEPAVALALQRAGARGLLISLAAGRMPAAVARYRDELGIRAPMILYNGALLRDPVNSRDLLSLTLPRGILGNAYEVFAHAPWNRHSYRATGSTASARICPFRATSMHGGRARHVVPTP